MKKYSIIPPKKQLKDVKFTEVGIGQMFYISDREYVKVPSFEYKHSSRGWSNAIFLGSRESPCYPCCFAGKDSVMIMESSVCVKTCRENEVPPGDYYTYHIQEDASIYMALVDFKTLLIRNGEDLLVPKCVSWNRENDITY